jgi:hypothetical protein
MNPTFRRYLATTGCLIGTLVTFFSSTLGREINCTIWFCTALIIICLPKDNHI